jgi:hypothetical protein
MERGARHNGELDRAAVATLNAVNAGSDRVGLVDGDRPGATIDANRTTAAPVVVVYDEVCAAIRRRDVVTAEASLRTGEKRQRAQ